MPSDADGLRRALVPVHRCYDGIVSLTIFLDIFLCSPEAHPSPHSAGRVRTSTQSRAAMRGSVYFEWGHQALFTQLGHARSEPKYYERQV